VHMYMYMCTEGLSHAWLSPIAPYLLTYLLT